MAGKLFAFILMPFDDGFDDIYKFGIKGACDEAGLYCERVDEQIFEETMLDRIYNQISKADIVIADMTGKNPNVFYETGYAHALNKRVILLTQTVEDIPFDLKHFSHIVYNAKIDKLKQELIKRITWFKDHPDKNIIQSDFEIDLFINGVKLEAGVEIEVFANSLYAKAINQASFAMPLKIDVHNRGVAIFNSTVKVGIMSKIFSRNSQKDDKNIIKIDADTFLHISPDYSGIFPSGWRSFDLLLFSNIVNLTSGERLHIDLDIQVFSELGVKSIPIVIQYMEEDWGI